ncbi:uncharacterized protein [Phyllobates terribilis]|uniref:uncharacterized protein n=1 Tax=Phyllobates terribilis TaxID=111132 RepID=UPI003CCB01E4
MFLYLPLIEHTCFYNTVLVARDIIWDCNSAPTPNAQNLITELLRTNPADRLGTGGSLEIKSHPFLSDLDFNNLLSQKPEYIPQLASDVDNSLFIDHSEIDHSVSEDEEGTSENNENLDFQNFTSSSERLSKLCTITTRTMNDEDQKSPPECTPATNTNISEIMGELEVTSWVFWSDPLILPDRQKESLSESDSDNAINSLPSSSPSSEFTTEEERKSEMNLSIDQQNSENGKKGKKRRVGVIYCAKCPCNRIYVGLTSRELRRRTRERVLHIKAAKETDNVDELKTLPRHFKKFHNSDPSGLQFFRLTFAIFQSWSSS